MSDFKKNDKHVAISQKKKRDDVSLIRVGLPFVIFSELQDKNRQGKCDGQRTADKNLPQSHGRNIGGGVEAHDQDYRHIQKSEAVRNPVLLMKTVPDIIEHIERKAQDQKRRQGEVCRLLPQPDPAVQQVE